MGLCLRSILLDYGRGRDSEGHLTPGWVLITPSLHLFPFPQTHGLAELSRAEQMGRGENEERWCLGPSGEPELLVDPWTPASLTGEPRSLPIQPPECVSMDEDWTGSQGEAQAPIPSLLHALMRRSHVNNSDQWKVQKSSG